jgi:hypothetical protein
MAMRMISCRRTVLAAIAAVAPAVVCAQQPVPPPIPKDIGAVAGVVENGMRGGPLVGALVTVVGTSRHATTDLQGHFRIDSVAPGGYSILVTHPLLDTLGLQLHSAPFTLAGGALMQVGLRTPSFDDVREGSCPIGGASYGPAILLGRVNKADSDEPAAGATVSLVFKNLDASLSPERLRTGRADATGLFAICGLPSRFSGNVQASMGGITTADLPVKLSGESIATTMLSIGVPGAGRAVLKGTVTSKAGAPIGGAQVSVTGTTAIATTANDGGFTLAGLPSGTREVVVRKIGFAQSTQVVTISSREPSTVIFVMGDAQVLAPVKVVGKLDDGLMKIGFTSRKQEGMGWYLTPEEIEKRNPLLTTDVLRSAGGLRVVNAANGTLLQATRGPSSTSDGCINIFVDHARFEQLNPGDVDGMMPTADLGAVEYYPSPSTTPAEFSVPGQLCATLVMWSKTRLTIPKP